MLTKCDDHSPHSEFSNPLPATNGITQRVKKKVSPQTFCIDKCKHATYWTKLSKQSPWSIWVIVAKFHTIPSST